MPQRRNKGKSEASGENLWEDVKKTTTPLKGERQNIPSPDLALEKETTRPPLPVATRKRAKAKQATQSSRPDDLTRRERRSIKQGRTSLDRTLDLHGMSQDQAHDYLSQALRQAQASDCRRLLVITGKSGVLRTKTPLWLKEGPLSDYVSKLATAGAGHGGEGALYVVLKRDKETPG